MKLAMFLPFEPDLRWRLASQAGVTDAVVKLAPELTDLEPPWEIATLAEAKKRFQNAGLTLAGLEGDQFDMSRIKLGLEGREEDVERYRRMIRNMGELEIPLLCYNFMAGIGWYRSRTNLPERGGATTSGFDVADLPADWADAPEKISSEKVWENYVWFLERVLPTAEKAGVRLGLHPDDPPISSLAGYGRTFYNAERFDRALGLADSPSHGVTFCQANFYAAGEDVPALIRRWNKRIFFVHFRDVRGSASAFCETFHDNGAHDMAAAVRAYREIGFDGPIRTDHAPTMAGEEASAATGYEALGHLFALGYLKGLWEAAAPEKKRSAE